ncbi:uncharacterized protein [Ptychodera flava]|uniref:uncharacterized protein n=1 Tax=Ptychodera flava TaxID=63121 RepID=UPI00396A1055
MATDVKSQVEARFKVLMDAYNAGDFKGVSDCYTTDCQCVAAKKDITIGHEACRKVCQEFLDSDAKTLEYKIEHLTSSPDGELAYLIARVSMFKADGSSAGIANNLLIWKKVDGEYFACVDMFN